MECLAGMVPRTERYRRIKLRNDKKKNFGKINSLHFFVTSILVTTGNAEVWATLRSSKSGQTDRRKTHLPSCLSKPEDSQMRW